MKAYHALVAALAHREDGTPLALFRILIGTTVFFELLLTRLSGSARFLWYPASAGGFKPSATTSHWLFHSLGGPTATNLDLVWAVGTAAAAMVAIGLGTRGFSALCLVCMQAMFTLQPGSGGGHDRVITIALFGLILATTDRTMSVACRVRTGRWTDSALVPAWPRYVGIWQLTVMYVFAGTAKLQPQWIPPGEMDAVYNMLLIPTWSRGSWEAWIAPLYPLTQLGSVITVLFESLWFIVPLALIWRATGRRLRFDPRPLFLGLGLVMHLTLWCLANLGPFSPITLSFYPLLFTGPELRRWRDRWWPRTSSAEHDS